VAERVLEQEMDDFALARATLHEEFEDPGESGMADAAFVLAPPAQEPIDDANRARIETTLESWLHNIRRPVL
jgi:hypothetical protein